MLPEPGASAPEAAPTPEPTAEASAAPATPEAPVPADPPADAETFPREYVERLRTENANYRTRAKTYEDVFEGYADEDREFLLEVVKGIKADPNATADQLRQVLDHIEANAPTAPPAAPSTGEPQYLTQADFDRMLSERDAAKERDQQIATIQSEAEKLGYEKGSAQYVSLLHIASTQTDGDLSKAHEAMQAERQKIIDEFMASKSDAATSTPAPVPQTGAAPGGERPITTLADSKRAMQAFLDAKGV